MNAKKFNAMLKAARELLRLYHAGTETDPHVVRWAQEQTAANPAMKRRPSPLRDAILAQFEGRDGLNREQIAAGIAGKTERDIASALHDMSHREPKFLWMHRHKGHKCGRYYASQAARDAAASDEHAALAAALELAEHKRRMKAAKVESNRVARAERRNAAKPPELIAPVKKAAPIELTQARKAFNGAVATFKGRAAKLTAPVRGRHSQGLARPMSDAEPIIPPGLTVTVCPGFRAPHERLADAPMDGAGFAAAGAGRDIRTGKAWA